MASMLEIDAASLAHQPDPDWDAGELDMGAERPWAPPPTREASGERPWMRVGFAVGTSLALLELLILLVAPAAPETAAIERAASEPSEVVATRGEGVSEGASSASIAVAPEQELTFASGDPSARALEQRGPRLPLPVFPEQVLQEEAPALASTETTETREQRSNAAATPSARGSAEPPPSVEPARPSSSPSAKRPEQHTPVEPEPELAPEPEPASAPQAAPEPRPEPAPLPGPDEVPSLTPSVEPGLPYGQLPE